MKCKFEHEKMIEKKASNAGCDCLVSKVNILKEERENMKDKNSKSCKKV